ncbi:hypothetical protein OVY48_07745 [Sphingobium sp. SA2]|uniref:hypothetical protein n=1 Tax=unclassified Sphingobium TaxID=2611147 RepID=UPI00123760DF|nr:MULTISPECIES: hypothetical protein [unclassified Sphingobium]MDT7533320.1 hypothetical protein [Sphingobium sp. SA2]
MSVSLSVSLSVIGVRTGAAASGAVAGWIAGDAGVVTIEGLSAVCSIGDRSTGDGRAGAAAGRAAAGAASGCGAAGASCVSWDGVSVAAGAGVIRESLAGTPGKAGAIGLGAMVGVADCGWAGADGDCPLCSGRGG